jgi:hypothetical protein
VSVAPHATIYVALLNEGTDVWRPVEAIPVKGGYQLIAADGYDINLEEWEYPPGSNVRCEMRELSGGPTLVAVGLI